MHSGQHSNIFYDIEALMNDEFYRTLLIGHIPFSRHYIGIETGGKKMAKIAHEESPWSKFSFINKEGILVGDKLEDEWLLVDDVVTTGASLLEAISIVGSNPREIIVAVDRRLENRDPSVIPVFEI